MPSINKRAIGAPTSTRARNRPIRRNLRRLPIVSILVLGSLVAAGVFASSLAPHDPLDTALSNQLRPPLGFGGTVENPLGTDATGRDILSRILFGARISLTVGMASLILGAAVGTLLGLVSGHFRGKTDALVMRAADMSLSYPVVLIALLLAAIYGASALNVVIAVGFTLWARFATVVRSEVRSVREREHVALARIAGASSARIIRRHLFPNVANTVIVLATVQLGWAILAEAALSFLGAGIPAPEPAWGSMVAQGREFVVDAWWVPTMPGLAILLTVLAVNHLGDWLRDTLDPQLRNL